MTCKSVCTGVLVAVLCLALVMPARAESIQTAGEQIIAGIVVVSVAIGVLVTVLIFHQKNKKHVITGCVNAGANGMSLNDEKDQRTYALSGNTAGVKPGDRMALEGKRHKESGHTFSFEMVGIRRDFGACRP